MLHARRTFGRRDARQANFNAQTPFINEGSAGKSMLEHAEPKLTAVNSTILFPIEGRCFLPGKSNDRQGRDPIFRKTFESSDREIVTPGQPTKARRRLFSLPEETFAKLTAVNIQVAAEITVNDQPTFDRAGADLSDYTKKGRAPCPSLNETAARKIFPSPLRSDTKTHAQLE